MIALVGVVAIGASARAADAADGAPLALHGGQTRVAESSLPTAPAEQPPAAEPQPLERPSRRFGAWTAKPLMPLAVRERPGGGRRLWTARPQTPTSGQAQRLLVLGERTVEGRSWLRVRLPLRPNNAVGWISRDHVSLMRTQMAIEVRLRARELRVLRAGVVVRRARVVIGSPATPTPVGLFAVQEAVRQRDPKAFLGTWAIHLTAHSEVLKRFNGGPARIAIHGRAGASLLDPLGTARSNGCVRVDNSFVDWLAWRVPNGTPVWVVR